MVEKEKKAVPLNSLGITFCVFPSSQNTWRKLNFDFHKQIAQNMLSKMSLSCFCVPSDLKFDATGPTFQLHHTHNVFRHICHILGYQQMIKHFLKNR